MGYHIGDKINMQGQNIQKDVELPHGIIGDFEIVAMRTVLFNGIEAFPQYHNEIVYFLTQDANKLYAWAKVGESFYKVTRIQPDWTTRDFYR